MRKIVVLLLSVFVSGQLIGQVNSDGAIVFDASIKTKYEYALKTEMSRFSVRNSRMGLSGAIVPSVKYRAQVELSSEGNFEILDLNVSMTLFEGFTVTLGQTHIPIFNSYIITPSQVMFANRAFIGKYFTGTRDIGLIANYRFKAGEVPFSFQIGTFNGSKINNPVWTNRPSYAARLEVGEMTGWRSTAKIYRYPYSTTEDFIIMGADIRYGRERYKFEAEVMNRHNRYDHTDRLSAYIQGGYSIPVNNFLIFKDVTPAVRWDVIGENIGENKFDATRITFGLGFALTDKPFGSLLRFDYEHYFVDRPIPEFNRYDEMDSNKFTVELLIIF